MVACLLKGQATCGIVIGLAHPEKPFLQTVHHKGRTTADGLQLLRSDLQHTAVRSLRETVTALLRQIHATSSSAVYSPIAWGTLFKIQAFLGFYQHSNSQNTG